jgi:hypothetical protein
MHQLLINSLRSNCFFKKHRAAQGSPVHRTAALQHISVMLQEPPVWQPVLPQRDANRFCYQCTNSDGQQLFCYIRDSPTYGLFR